MISRERRKELKNKLAVMIDIAFRNDECFPDDPIVTEEELQYVQNLIDTIMSRLQD